MGVVGNGQNGPAALPFLTHEANNTVLFEGSQPVTDRLLANFELSGNSFGGPAFVTPQQGLAAASKLVLGVVLESLMQGELLKVSQLNASFAAHAAKIKQFKLILRDYLSRDGP